MSREPQISQRGALESRPRNASDRFEHVAKRRHQVVYRGGMSRANLDLDGA
jgi:hypothetical protein